MSFAVKLLLLPVLLVLATEAVHFNCRFTNMTFSGVLGVVYACDVTLTVTGSTTLESISGSHQSGRTNDDVEIINMARQNLTFIPEGIDSFFKNLRGLEFWYTPLTAISSRDLQPFPKIIYFRAAGSRLTSLPGDLFSFTPNIQHLSMRENQIEHIGHDLVKNLNSLAWLNFGNNSCIDRRTTTRAGVLELAPLLSVLCPPQDIATTTEAPSDHCPCDEEIEVLRLENQQLMIEMKEKNREIQELQSSNVLFEERLKEVEMQLREIVSMPCAA